MGFIPPLQVPDVSWLTSSSGEFPLISGLNCLDARDFLIGDSISEESLKSTSPDTPCVLGGATELNIEDKKEKEALHVFFRGKVVRVGLLMFAKVGWPSDEGKSCYAKRICRSSL